MKKIFTFLCGVVFTYASFAQANNSSAATTSVKPATANSGSPAMASSQGTKPPEDSLHLIETEFDFGKIPQGKPVTHVFEFTNTGATPFSLDNVQASCGCTTPEWNKDVIAPGATSKIIVGYNAMNDGPFAKPVTITYNGNQTKQIIIKGEVWKTPVTSAPENTSVNSLKNE
jgi:hypothetical protein